MRVGLLLKQGLEAEGRSSAGRVAVTVTQISRLAGGIPTCVSYGTKWVLSLSLCFSSCAVSRMFCLGRSPLSGLKD